MRSTPSHGPRPDAGTGAAIREALREYPVILTIPVEWGDQDALGHVNNTVYLRWCETARVVYLERAGMWQRIEKEGRGPILAHIGCNFRRQVTFPDTMHIGSRVTRIGNSSIRMEHCIVGEAEGAVVADADSTMVFYDYRAGASLAVPQDLRDAISKLEGKPL